MIDMTPEEILDAWKEWEKSHKRKALAYYESYYETDNMPLGKKVQDRRRRNKTPNNKVPTAYYTTVVDSMAGYLFSDVVYKSEDEEYQKTFREFIKKNRGAVKDMHAGVEALAKNRAIEYVYTKGVGDIEIKFSWLKPSSVALLWSDDIEPELEGAIWCHDYDGNNYKLDLIQERVVKHYQVTDDKIVYIDDDTELPFSQVPICLYETQVIGNKPPFHQVLAYIDALDWLISGNSNEIDRIVDALLVLGKAVKKEDLDKMDEWKALQNYKDGDRAEFLTKDMSPQFREYVSKLLVQEIHKHSHVVDWYNPDTGITGATSGKALKTRLFDMDVYSKRIEKIVREGFERRVELIGEAMSKLKSVAVAPVEIVFNRTMINDFEDKVLALNQATFLSIQTKVEESGLSWETEKQRLDDEAESRTEEIPALEIEDE